jgi:hypothetical protein
VLQGSTDIPAGTGTFAFAHTALGYSTSDITFAIHNIGTAPLNLTGSPRVEVAGSEFVVVSQPSTPVATNGSTTFTMHFTPSTEGGRSATVTILNDDPDNSTFTFTVQGPASTVRLPKTGQTTNYGTEDDGQLQVGVSWPAPRFTTGTDVVTDTLTGLMWTKSANFMPTTYPTFDVEGSNDGRVSWQNALVFIADQVNATSYGSYNDWRLPNLNELRSLVNCGGSDYLHTWLAAQGFADVKSDAAYWSSTTFANLTSWAWNIDLNIGEFSQNNKTASYFYVWPVRTVAGTPTIRIPRTGQTTGYYAGDDGNLQKGASWPATRFTNNGDGTMTDHLTGLIWERAPSATDRIWSDALSHASGLTLGGASDWRLPNLGELASLLNSGVQQTRVYLEGQGFSLDSVNMRYWTSTTSGVSTGWAWYLHLGVGGIVTNDKNQLNRVIAVRSPP